MAAQGLAEILKEDGVENAQAIEIFGSLGDSNSLNRSEGWKQVEEETGAWTTVVQEPTEWKTENFKTGTVNALAAYPDANVMFVASDFAFSAIQAALEESGRWVPRGEEGHMLSLIHILVTAENRVVAATQLAERVPSCPMFFDMT